jgi:glycosyltransferase involved in cell wall biosynthesis
MSTPLRILVVSDYKSTHTVRPEAEIFIGLLRKGHQVTIMTHPETEYGKRFLEAGAHLIPYHPLSKRDKKAQQLIRQAIIDRDIQIVHFFNSKASMNGMVATRGLDVKICLYRGFTGHLHWYDPTFYFKYMHPRVDRIVCNSIGVEELFHRQLFFDKKRTRVINKGHDLTWYQDVQASDRKEFGISPDTLILVNVANNRKMKGIPYLLEAINQLPADADIVLLSVGKDMDIDPHLDILAKGNNRDKVIFTGFRRDALSIVKMSDIFILTSIYGESICKAVIESMSLGRAPIISNIPGNRELVDHEISGLVFPSKDVKSITAAIMRLYKDRTLLKKLQAGAKAHIATKLNTSNTVDGYEKMYLELVAH